MASPGCPLCSGSGTYRIGPRVKLREKLLAQHGLGPRPSPLPPTPSLDGSAEHTQEGKDRETAREEAQLAWLRRHLLCGLEEQERQSYRCPFCFPPCSAEPAQAAGELETGEGTLSLSSQRVLFIPVNPERAEAVRKRLNARLEQHGVLVTEELTEEEVVAQFIKTESPMSCAPARNSTREALLPFAQLPVSHALSYSSPSSAPPASASLPSSHSAAPVAVPPPRVDLSNLSTANQQIIAQLVRLGYPFERALSAVREAKLSPILHVCVDKAEELEANDLSKLLLDLGSVEAREELDVARASRNQKTKEDLQLGLTPLWEEDPEFMKQYVAASPLFLSLLTRRVEMRVLLHTLLRLRASALKAYPLAAPAYLQSKDSRLSRLLLCLTREEVPVVNSHHRRLLLQCCRRMRLARNRGARLAKSEENNEQAENGSLTASTLSLPSLRASRTSSFPSPPHSRSATSPSRARSVASPLPRFHRSGACRNEQSFGHFSQRDCFSCSSLASSQETEPCVETHGFEGRSSEEAPAAAFSPPQSPSPPPACTPSRTSRRTLGQGTRCRGKKEVDSFEAVAVDTTFSQSPEEGRSPSQERRVSSDENSAPSRHPHPTQARFSARELEREKEDLAQNRAGCGVPRTKRARRPAELQRGPGAKFGCRGEDEAAEALRQPWRGCTDGEEASGRGKKGEGETENGEARTESSGGGRRRRSPGTESRDDGPHADGEGNAGKNETETASEASEPREKEEKAEVERRERARGRMNGEETKGSEGEDASTQAKRKKEESELAFLEEQWNTSDGDSTKAELLEAFMQEHKEGLQETLFFSNVGSVGAPPRFLSARSRCALLLDLFSALSSSLVSSLASRAAQPPDVGAGHEAAFESGLAEANRNNGAFDSERSRRVAPLQRVYVRLHPGVWPPALVFRVESTDAAARSAAMALATSLRPDQPLTHLSEGSDSEDSQQEETGHEEDWTAEASPPSPPVSSSGRVASCDAPKAPERRTSSPTGAATDEGDSREGTEKRGRGGKEEEREEREKDMDEEREDDDCLILGEGFAPHACPSPLSSTLSCEERASSCEGSSSRARPAFSVSGCLSRGGTSQGFAGKDRKGGFSPENADSDDELQRAIAASLWTYSREQTAKRKRNGLITDFFQVSKKPKASPVAAAQKRSSSSLTRARAGVAPTIRVGPRPRPASRCGSGKDPTGKSASGAPARPSVSAKAGARQHAGGLWDGRRTRKGGAGEAEDAGRERAEFAREEKREWTEGRQTQEREEHALGARQEGDGRRTKVENCLRRDADRLVGNATKYASLESQNRRSSGGTSPSFSPASPSPSASTGPQLFAPQGLHSDRLWSRREGQEVAEEEVEAAVAELAAALCDDSRSVEREDSAASLSGTETVDAGPSGGTWKPLVRTAGSKWSLVSCAYTSVFPPPSAPGRRWTSKTCSRSASVGSQAPHASPSVASASAGSPSSPCPASASQRPLCSSLLLAEFAKTSDREKGALLAEMMEELWHAAYADPRLEGATDATESAGRSVAEKPPSLAANHLNRSSLAESSVGSEGPCGTAENGAGAERESENRKYSERRDEEGMRSRSVAFSATAGFSGHAEAASEALDSQRWFDSEFSEDEAYLLRGYSTEQPKQTPAFPLRTGNWIQTSRFLSSRMRANLQRVCTRGRTEKSKAPFACDNNADEEKTDDGVECIGSSAVPSLCGVRARSTGKSSPCDHASGQIGSAKSIL
ncbi:conserved hypothetical protein [Neospora caninum Liverpool]|uniref:Uncharacterized protein n=1 Tax=Neospora caninum (strain Liverpool) TaxID=572307 RepID=F0V9L8_NEOCL|nr:conserved hypothetical protein [Neospora caninum Liverpool]CBZ50444.1 conserved hypothetical protein [Neospora caninum Liverpool]CEL65053.1 TPA: hypothetical protein BN1204_009130 [Neospora caninum Liverpool]|eukprot:XP_003880477.1 conserved hypothetical protein [Neospora caninum Liverpool]